MSTADPLARRQFGKMPLTVPPIAIGCAPIGNMGDTFGYDVSEEDAVATILRALESPIPYIDTAAHYGDGESERRVGLALREAGGLPAGAVLQTKEGRELENNDYSGDTFKWRMERSLKLLGVDYVDVVYLHDHEWTTFEDAMAPGGPVEVLFSYKEQGVVGAVGLAGGPVPNQLRFVETDMFDALIHHNRYTLLNRSAEPLIQAAYDRGMAVLNAAPYGSGMLVKGPDAYPRYAYQQASQQMVDRVRNYQAIAESHGVPLAAVSLQFSTRDPRTTSTIVGMSRPSRIDDTLRYLTTPIPDALWDEISDVPFDSDDPEANRFK